MGWLGRWLDGTIYGILIAVNNFTYQAESFIRLVKIKYSGLEMLLCTRKE
jgi:hypothetical protein